MTISRRSFVKKASVAGGLSVLPFSISQANPKPGDEVLEKLDKALKQPVLKTSFFPNPVVISDIKLLHYNGSFICKVYSADGAEGISVSNNLRMDYLYPIFLKRVAPFFINKDARQLDFLVEEVYRHASNYKMQSYALGVPVATVEFAILDLLGKISGLSMGDLLGGVVNTEVAIYLATRFRDKSAEESLEKARELVQQNGYKAVKFKIGTKMGANKELIKGRTEKLIPLARKILGDDMWLGVDANGGYDVKEAIRIGKILSDHEYGFYEEPVPFDWYQETKQVADAVKVPLAGGEQESSMRNYRWMIGEKALEVFRPDMFYFGGMIRSIRVARMAEVQGLTCVPHLSGSGLGYLYAMHYISAIPNAGAFHPNSRDKDNPIPIECETSDLTVKEGLISVPTGSGLGVTVDPGFLAKHKEVKPSL